MITSGGGHDDAEVRAIPGPVRSSSVKRDCNRVVLGCTPPRRSARRSAGLRSTMAARIFPLLLLLICQVPPTVRAQEGASATSLEARFLAAGASLARMREVIDDAGRTGSPGARAFLRRLATSSSDLAVADLARLALREDPGSNYLSFILECAAGEPRPAEKIRLLSTLTGGRFRGAAGAEALARALPDHAAGALGSGIVDLLRCVAAQGDSAAVPDLRAAARFALRPFHPPEMRRSALALAREIGTDAADLLLDAVRERDADLLVPAILALADLRPSGAAPIVARCLVEASSEQRRQILGQLAGLPRPDVALWMALVEALPGAGFDAVGDVALAMRTPALDALVPFALSKLRCAADDRELCLGLLVAAHRHLVHATDAVAGIAAADGLHTKAAVAHTLTVLRRDPAPFEHFTDALLAEPDLDRRLDGIEALADLRLEGPHIERFLGKAATSATLPWPVRAHAFRIAARSDAPSLTRAAIAALSDGIWQVRLAAVEALAARRSASALLPLADVVATDQSRVALAAAGALAALTGRDLGADADGWRRFIRTLPDGFEPLAAPPLRAPGGSPPDRYTPRFYGLSLESDRPIFVLDVSGSMADAGKIETLKDELGSVIGTLPPRARFNLISFATRVRSWADRLVAATSENRGAARSVVGALVADGGTDLHGGLMRAIQDPNADTIVLVSDGMPSAGALTDPAAIRREVRRVNRWKRIVIHTIHVESGAGAEDFLSGLAVDNGGTFLHRPPAAGGDAARRPR